jgi:superfamily I DNA/RNA helicase
MMRGTPSPLQENIFRHVRESPRHLVVQAYAGSGKTTTMVELLNHIPEHLTVFLGAFNKRIQQELEERVSNPELVKFPQRVKVKTLHGLGYVSLMKAWRKLSPHLDEDERDKKLAKDVVPTSLGHEGREDVLKLMSLAKKYGFSPKEATDDALFDLMSQYEIVPESVDAKLYVDWVRTMLTRSLEPSALISFDDMVYLPAVLNMRTGQYDYVIIDEAQDMNRAQLKVAMKAMKPRGTMIVVGDENQCISVNTKVRTPRGLVSAGKLKSGDEVIAYRNERNVTQQVKSVVHTAHREVLKVTTESGKSLTMTPSHRLWAMPLTLKKGWFLTYLMYRHDLGFRVGITNHGYSNDPQKSYGQRPVSEGAEKMWLLDVCETREEALLKETSYSLKYSIPTVVFKGEGRGLNQARINAIFQVFGESGYELLEAKQLSFNYPHWSATTRTLSKNPHTTVDFVGHNAKGTLVQVEGHLNKSLLRRAGFSVTPARRGGIRVRRLFSNHAQAEQFASSLSNTLGAQIKWRLTTPKNPATLITASGLLPGMEVLVFSEQGLQFDRVRSVMPAGFSDVVDIEVDDANNFYANDILTHNCIYSFNGALSNAMQEMATILKADVLPLSVTYRCPKAVVAEANKYVPELQAHETAPNGEVRRVTSDYMKANWRPGDFVISRSNAPLIALVLWAMTRGVRVRIEGRDMGGSLIKLVKNSATTSVPDFLRWLDKHTEKEAERLEAAGKHKSIDALYDRKEALIALTEGLRSIDEVILRIHKVFDQAKGSNAVILTSTHRAKGLEADRVWVLRWTFRPDRGGEESNLYYVACTRSKSQLFLVSDPRKSEQG